MMKNVAIVESATHVPNRWIVRSEELLNENRNIEFTRRPDQLEGQISRCR
jgi:hypothetical protein